MARVAVGVILLAAAVPLQAQAARPHEPSPSRKHSRSPAAAVKPSGSPAPA